VVSSFLFLKCRYKEPKPALYTYCAG